VESLQIIISKIGEVSTFAWICGNRGYIDGYKANSKFDLPRNNRIDEDGNVIVYDYGNVHFRLINSEGINIEFFSKL